VAHGKYIAKGQPSTDMLCDRPPKAAQP